MSDIGMMADSGDLLEYTSSYMTMARVWVSGTPKAQPRPKAFARVINGEPTARVYDPGTAEGWKGSIALACRKDGPPFDCPIELEGVFWFPRPKALLRKKDPVGPIPHTKKPDLDNLVKAVKDCMTDLGWWRDDSLVVSSRFLKFYLPKDCAEPGLALWVNTPDGE